MFTTLRLPPSSPPGGGRGPQVQLTLEKPPNNDGYTVPGTVQARTLSLAVGSYRSHEIEVGRDYRRLGTAVMVLNLNAPNWTPGQGSSGEHGEVGGMTAHRVGNRQRGG